MRSHLTLILTFFLVTANVNIMCGQGNGSYRSAINTTETKTVTSLGFYNLENLFDTVPSAFYNDLEYTPDGTRHWDSQRLENKINNLRRVINLMQTDILGICEIENEASVMCLVERLKTDYCYIHRTTRDKRGMDLALLYKADRFTPKKTELLNSGYSREFLHISGVLTDFPINILVCHAPSNFNSTRQRLSYFERLTDVADSLYKISRVDNGGVIIMGDFNTSPDSKLMKKLSSNFYNPFLSLSHQGIGSYCYKNRWIMFDNIIISSNFLHSDDLHYLKSGIFVRDFMLKTPSDINSGAPLRSFESGRYTAGFSDHLPVYLFLER